MPPSKEESDDALTQYVLSPAANFFRSLQLTFVVIPFVRIFGHYPRSLSEAVALIL
jgi:hypothetical protein